MAKRKQKTLEEKVLDWSNAGEEVINEISKDDVGGMILHVVVCQSETDGNKKLSSNLVGTHNEVVSYLVSLMNQNDEYAAVITEAALTFVEFKTQEENDTSQNEKK